MPIIARTKPDLKLEPTGETAHYADGARISGIVGLEIEDDAGGGFYLFHCDQSGHQLIDTWHETFEDALQQASYEYGLNRADWLFSN